MRALRSSSSTLAASEAVPASMRSSSSTLAASEPCSVVREAFFLSRAASLAASEAFCVSRDSCLAASEAFSPDTRSSIAFILTNSASTAGHPGPPVVTCSRRLPPSPAWDSTNPSYTTFSPGSIGALIGSGPALSGQDSCVTQACSTLNTDAAIKHERQPCRADSETTAPKWLFSTFASQTDSLVTQGALVRVAHLGNAELFR